jgi:hypothetical protein
MKVCDLNTGLGQMAQALSHLKECWGQTQEHWRDDMARQFEQTHLHDVPIRLQRVAQAAQRLAAVIDAAERELGDRSDEG